MLAPSALLFRASDPLVNFVYACALKGQEGRGTRKMEALPEFSPSPRKQKKQMKAPKN